ncbi:MAG TPA: class I SAM-dependent methyltransferase [Myxococcota bacterium]|nr:class I SAM-dependent methyltransferase [Myxococcota bacterium]
MSKAGPMKLVRNQIANELRKVVDGPVRYPIAVEFADGSRYSSHHGRETEITFVIKKGAELSLATKGYAGLIDAWVKGDIDIVGNRALRKLMHMTSLGKEGSKLRPLGIAEQWFREVFATNNRYYEQAHDNALYHYGNPTGLFREQLGAVMKYTEGLFGPDKGISLDEAQVRSLEYFARAGMDLVADKTARGETVKWAEFGGGWMPQGLYTALNFPNVDYTNIGRTESQNRVAAALIEANGLSDRVRIIEGDARDYVKPEHRHQYDIVHQAGVLEHAGPFELDAWFKGMANAVKPGGYLVMSNMTYPLRDAVFVEAVTGKHFFPGGTMPAEGDLAVCARKYGFELVWEAEMRDDYALTLDRWAESFAAAWDKLAPTDPAFYNEPMRRVWELFLEGSSSALGSAGHSANLNLRHYVMRMGPSGDGERPSVSQLSDARQPTLDEVLGSLKKRSVPKLFDDLPADVRAKLSTDRELASDMRPGVPKPLDPVKNLLRALTGETPRP